MDIKNKRILITAGPTWVPIDSVRVISNIATGATGMALAEQLSRLGAKVTLLLGQIPACQPKKDIKIIRYKFFEELYRLFKQALQKGSYDIVIHSAAVSDYKPKDNFHKKVRSGAKAWVLRLEPTKKIINLVKGLKPKPLLVGFKFEPFSSKGYLLQQAHLLMQHAKADLIVANTTRKDNYCAYILGQEEILGPFVSKAKLAAALIKKIGAYYA